MIQNRRIEKAAYTKPDGCLQFPERPDWEKSGHSNARNQSIYKITWSTLVSTTIITDINSVWIELRSWNSATHQNHSINRMFSLFCLGGRHSRAPIFEVVGRCWLSLRSIFEQTYLSNSDLPGRKLMGQGRPTRSSSEKPEFKLWVCWRMWTTGKSETVVWCVAVARLAEWPQVCKWVV